MEPFTYQGKTKPIRMSYYQVPGDVFDDAERLVAWAASALAAARRAKEAKKHAEHDPARCHRDRQLPARREGQAEIPYAPDADRNRLI